MKDHVVHEKPANALQEMKLWIVLSPKSLNTRMILARSRTAFVRLVHLFTPTALMFQVAIRVSREFYAEINQTNTNNIIIYFLQPCNRYHLGSFH